MNIKSSRNKINQGNCGLTNFTEMPDLIYAPKALDDFFDTIIIRLLTIHNTNAIIISKST